MNPIDPSVVASSHGLLGLYALLAFLVGFLVWALKTDACTSLLAVFGRAPLPKRAVPWIALALGFSGGAMHALIAGKPVLDALIAGGWGLMSGAMAIAGDQTVGKAISRTPSVASIATMLCLALGSWLLVVATSISGCSAAQKQLERAVISDLMTWDQIACVMGKGELASVSPAAAAIACGVVPAALPIVDELLAAQRAGHALAMAQQADAGAQ